VRIAGRWQRPQGGEMEPQLPICQRLRAGPGIRRPRGRSQGRGTRDETSVPGGHHTTRARVGGS